jgi:adenylate cyclase
MSREGLKGISFLLAPLGALAVSFFLFFSSLDNRVFDLFLRALPSLTEDDRVTVLTLDDDSITYAKGFPFPRDVMADIIVFLKEMGVQATVFDLNYLDPAPERLNRDYAAEVFSRYLDSGFGRINETAGLVIDGFAEGSIKPEERGLISREFRDLTGQVRRELESSMDYLTRDVDAYFAGALGFTDSSWLTLTMIAGENVLGDGDAVISIDEETESFLEEHIALKNIKAANDNRSPERVGLMPALFKLLASAKRAGFVNANPDRDGYLRRIDLLVKYRDRYYGHLALAALRESLDKPAILVSDSSVTLQNALLRGERRDIVIPRSEDGTMLLKWPKKTFYEYRVRSLLEFIQYLSIESVFAENLALMESSGFFAWWDQGENPWGIYDAANRVKESLFAVGPADGGNPEYRFDDWLSLREDFIRSTGEFLYGPYEERILNDVGNSPEIAAYVGDLFRACREQFSRMEEIRESAAALKGHFCIIGADATSMTDNGLITFEEDYPNVGTYAVAANMILSGEFLDDAPRYVSFIAALLLSLAMAVTVKKLNTLRATIAGIIGISITVAGFLLFFVISKRYVGLVVPFASVTLTFFSLSAINFFTTSREKSFLRMAFSRYLAPEFINELIADPSKLNLGGEKREMTALFTDIQGFSTISEQLDPAHLVTLLNLYLTEMSTIIMENRGTIDKYEGDAIIAFFGAPLYREDHAELACRSAIRIKQAERELNKKILAEHLSPSPLFTRIGVNTGDMIVGNMGADNKMDYTIMGNAVNLASRLEGANKYYVTRGILISEYTKEKTGETFLCRKLDRVRVVGIKKPVRLYELLSLRDEAGEEDLKIVAEWEQALAYFEAREFKAAAEIFASLAKRHGDDSTVELYRTRSEAFLSVPPPPDWDGVHNLSEK